MKEKFVKKITNNIADLFERLIREFEEIKHLREKRELKSAVDQVRIVSPELTEEQIELAIENGGTDTIFADKILDDRRKKAINDLKSIKIQQTELRELERDILELQQLFQEMARLVNEQGESIDKIQEHTEKAVVDADKAVATLDVIKSEQSKRTKRQACCAGLLCCGCCAATTVAGGAAAGAGGCLCLQTGCKLAPLAALAACTIM